MGKWDSPNLNVAQENKCLEHFNWTIFSLSSQFCSPNFSTFTPLYWRGQFLLSQGEEGWQWENGILPTLSRLRRKSAWGIIQYGPFAVFGAILFCPEIQENLPNIAGWPRTVPILTKHAKAKRSSWELFRGNKSVAMVNAENFLSPKRPRVDQQQWLHPDTLFSSPSPSLEGNSRRSRTRRQSPTTLYVRPSPSLRCISLIYSTREPDIRVKQTLYSSILVIPIEKRVLKAKSRRFLIQNLPAAIWIWCG